MTDPGRSPPAPGAVEVLGAAGRLPATTEAVVTGRSFAVLASLRRCPPDARPIVLVGSHGAVSSRHRICATVPLVPSHSGQCRPSSWRSSTGADASGRGVPGAPPGAQTDSVSPYTCARRCRPMPSAACSRRPRRTGGVARGPRHRRQGGPGTGRPRSTRAARSEPLRTVSGRPRRVSVGDDVTDESAFARPADVGGSRSVLATPAQLAGCDPCTAVGSCSVLAGPALVRRPRRPLDQSTAQSRPTPTLEAALVPAPAVDQGHQGRTRGRPGRRPPRTGAAAAGPATRPRPRPARPGPTTAGAAPADRPRAAPRWPPVPRRPGPHRRRPGAPPSAASTRRRRPAPPRRRGGHGRAAAPAARGGYPRCPAVTPGGRPGFAGPRAPCRRWCPGPPRPLARTRTAGPRLPPAPRQRGCAPHPGTTSATAPSRCAMFDLMGSGQASSPSPYATRTGVRARTRARCVDPVGRLVQDVRHGRQRAGRWRPASAGAGRPGPAGSGRSHARGPVDLLLGSPDLLEGQVRQGLRSAVTTARRPAGSAPGPEHSSVSVATSRRRRPAAARLGGDQAAQGVAEQVGTGPSRLQGRPDEQSTRSSASAVHGVGRRRRPGPGLSNWPQLVERDHPPAGPRQRASTARKSSLLPVNPGTSTRRTRPGRRPRGPGSRTARASGLARSAGAAPRSRPAGSAREGGVLTSPAQ